MFRQLVRERGEHGVHAVFRNLIAELDLVLGLSGHRAVAELGIDSLVATP